MKPVPFIAKKNIGYSPDGFGTGMWGPSALNFLGGQFVIRQ